MRASSKSWFWIGLAAVTLVGIAPLARAQESTRVVEIVAKRFEFTPKEITLKRGEQVTIRVRSADVTHGFFQKALGIDLDVEPGKVAEVTITPQVAGRYLTICDHFCGAGHGNMNMTIVVE